jgi:ubiquinone biosynthesis protein
LPEVSELAGGLARSADRMAVALVTLGLYIAASLLMQHSIGPRIFGGLPLLAAIGYVLALWFTLRLVISIGRAGGF